MIDGNDVIIAYKNGSIIDAHFKKQKLTPDKSDDFESKNLTKLGDDQLKFTFSRKIKTDDTDHDTNLNQLKGIFIIEKNGRKEEKPKQFDFTSLKEFQQSSKFETEEKNINENYEEKGANGRSRKVTEIETLEEVHEITYDEETDTTHIKNENGVESGSVLNHEEDDYDYEDFESYEDDHKMEVKESQKGKLSQIGRGYESKIERNESVLTEIESNDNQKTDQQLDHDSQLIEKEVNKKGSKTKEKSKQKTDEKQNIEEEEEIYEYDESSEVTNASKNQSKSHVDKGKKTGARSRARVDLLENETIKEEEYEDRNEIYESYETDSYSEETESGKPRYGIPPDDDEDVTTTEHVTPPDDDEDESTTTEPVTQLDNDDDDTTTEPVTPVDDEDESTTTEPVTPDGDEDESTTTESVTPPDDDEDESTTTDPIIPPEDDEDTTTTEYVTPPEDNDITTKPWWQGSTTTEAPWWKESTTTEAPWWKESTPRGTPRLTPTTSTTKSTTSKETTTTFSEERPPPPDTTTTPETTTPFSEEPPTTIPPPITTPETTRFTTRSSTPKNVTPNTPSRRPKWSTTTPKWISIEDSSSSSEEDYSHSLEIISGEEVDFCFKDIIGLSHKSSMELNCKKRSKGSKKWTLNTKFTTFQECKKKHRVIRKCPPNAVFWNVLQCCVDVYDFPCKSNCIKLPCDLNTRD